MNHHPLYKIALSFFIATSFLLMSCKKEMIQHTPETADLYTIIRNDKANFSLLTAAVERAGLQALLSDASVSYTLLAPSDEAFTSAGLGLSTIQATEPATIRAILEYHVLADMLHLDDSFESADIRTLSGASVHVKGIGEHRFAANGADVINTNNRASNGVLQVINRVLIASEGKSVYEQANSHPELTFLAVALRRASMGAQDLVQLLSSAGDFTLFAPSNAAFIAAGYPDSNSIKNANAETLDNMLTYHLLNSRKYTVDMTDSLGTPSVNQKTVYLGKRTVVPNRTSYTRGFFNGAAFDRFNANIVATNGVIHIIPELIVPPTQTLHAIINSNTSLTRFAAAVRRASEVDDTDFDALLLSDSHLHTITAPNNTAFGAAGYPTLTAVNNADPYVLAEIVKAHLFTGNRFLYQFRNNTVVSPFAGHDLAVTLNASTGAVALRGEGNASAVSLTKSSNFFNTNGILYTVNQFLLP